MFIEELIIDGFKSYSTRTSVGPFDRQFNAITGLNGSGKSNILDSICFVLGISNLQQVRVGNLSELVYKQGQAGVTKASVTVVFNNEDKSCSPVGYETHDRITITRQIIIGGRNRYLLNSHNVQQNQIQNLFHSVSLNVNNPHFLIMQGRITKVINMKPQETLSMIEEAAGTRMYENKKAGALKTLDKKQAKVDEINKLLSEEITPTLEKLQKERANYMLWVSNNNEMERLQRFCIAYEYLQVKHRLENRNAQLDELEEMLQALVSGVKQLDDRDIEIQKLVKTKTAQRDKQRSTELKKLEDEHSKLSKDVVSSESKLKNRESDLKTQQEARKNAQGALGELRAQMEQKEKVYQKEKEKWDALIAQEDSIKKDIEKAQWQMSALTAGMAAQPAPDGEGEGKSLSAQLLETQTRLQSLDSEQKKRSLGIASLKERIASAEQNMSKSKTEGKKLLKEKSAIEALITERRNELQKCKFDPETHSKLVSAAQQGEASLHSLQQKLDSMRAHIGGIDFQYQDPYKGFNRHAVKGVVAKLFHIQPDFVSYHRALEVAAGGRLFNVVTDTEETGKALIEKGQLRRRVTIVPLNKIMDPTIRPDVVRQAKRVVPAGGDVHCALEIIGFQKEIQAAMKFIFGGYLVCDTSETAKQVTFHPDVRVRSVTKQGDMYDPQGTLTGGSAPRGGNILQQLQELSQVEKQVQAQHAEYMNVRAQLDKNKAAASQYAALEQELKVREHEFSLMQDRINHSEHHASETAVQEAKEQLAELEEKLKNMPEEKKELEKRAKNLEKEIKSLDSSREDQIQVLEEKVERLKGDARKHAEKIEKQREKFESLNVEYEVARNELLAQEGKDQATGQSHGDFEAETQALKEGLERQREAYKLLGEKLEGMRGHLKELDETLAGLSTESATNRQQREEKELEQKRMRHKIEQLQKDDKEAGNVVTRMEKEHPWIEKEKNFFGKKGTDFDFEANNYGENKKRSDELEKQQNKLGKSINKKSGMLKRVRSHLIANVLFAVLVYSLYVQMPALAAIAKMLSPTAHSLTGGALSLLLVFRTNSSYNRFYEARCLWGKVTNTIREMARFAHTNLSGLTREHALSLTAAYPTVMLQHLQQNDPIYRPTTWSAQQEAVLSKMLSEQDYKCLYATRNRAFTVGKMLGAVYRYWYYNADIMAKRFGNKDGTMTDTQRALMQANVQSERTQIELMLETMCNCFGACERIVRSQVPPSYSRHTSRFLSVWCFTLPFVLVHPLQWLMIPTVTIICWSLFVIEEVGHVIEDPFNIHLAIAGSGQEDGLIIEGSQMNLKLDSFERIPGPSTRVNGKATYDGEELDFDYAEFHEEWLAEARKKAGK